MLVALKVRNFVLMDYLEIEFSPRLNILTGETGAGKSIIIGAIQVVLGGKTSMEQIRSCCDEAEVEALFDIESMPNVQKLLELSGIRNQDELIIRRVIQKSGRTKTYLNGRLSSLGELQTIARDLADIASQHESIALSDPTTHLEYLDRFANIGEEKLDLCNLVIKLEVLQKEIEQFQSNEKEKLDQEAFLKFQLESIERVDPKENEYEELKEERNRLKHVGRLSEVTGRIVARLEEDESSICDELGRLSHDLHSISEIDASLSEPSKILESCLDQLCDVSREILRYSSRLEGNPDRLVEVEERLFQIEQLLRQHGPSMGDLLQTKQRIHQQICQFENREEILVALLKEKEKILMLASVIALELSEKRKKASIKLAKEISNELQELGMGGAQVLVEVAPLEGHSPEFKIGSAKLGRTGIDKVEFLISPNKGMSPKPLRKIASGGEMSRSLLALKRVLAKLSPKGFYIFDEVDSGVGGAISEKMGRSISEVAKHHQVLCITHLAPIAAYADAHYIVTKDVDGTTTKSQVVLLDSKSSIAEIARMLSGAKVSSASIKAASEMIQHAKEQKT